jgi:hypothetical protein
MTLDDRLPAPTQTEQYNDFQQRDLTLVLSDDAGEVGPDVGSDEALEVPIAPGHPLKCSRGNIPSPIEPAIRAAPLKETKMLNGNPFRPGEYWNTAPHRSVLPGGQLTISPDWEVSGPKVEVMQPVTPEPERAYLPMPVVLPCRMKVKQYVDGRVHREGLGDEARKLYNAMSFKVLRDGRGFNTFVTVTAWYLGLTRHAEFGELISVMNKAIAGWLKARPKRTARFHLTEEVEHSYIYVLERSGYEHGLHFHLLCSIPPSVRKEFRTFLADWWEAQAGLDVPTNAVHVQGFDGGGPVGHYVRQSIKFRYIMKTIRPGVVCFDQESRQRYAIEFMKPWFRRGVRPDLLPIRTRQLYGISRDLDVQARKVWGEEVGWTYLSKADQGRFDELYNGSEVAAWQARFIDEPDWWKRY